MSDEKGLPSSGELAKLPKGSLATYAIRCALRVQPLLSSWSEPSKKYKKAVLNLNRSFRILTLSSDRATAAQTANTAFVAACNILNETKDLYDYPDAAKAAEAARAAVRVVGITRPDAKVKAPSEDAVLAALVTDAITAIAAARADYDRLMATKIEITDTLETGYLGDIWSGFPPDWYVKAKADYDKTIAKWEHELGEELEGNLSGSAKIGISSSAKLAGVISDDADFPIEFYIDPGDARKETIQNVLECLSDLHIAAGGFGLEFISDDMNIKAMEGITK